MLRRLVEMLEIPLFDRVTRIEHVMPDFADLPIERQEVATLHELERITARKHEPFQLEDSDLAAVRATVPPCRVASVQQTGSQIDIDLEVGPMQGCSEP
mgnify:FL=1